MIDETVSELAEVDILLVEDSAVQAEVLRRKLTGYGFSVAIARDGPAALGLLNARHFSIVLLDLTMPGMDGHEVLDQIRQRYSRVELPVIIVTWDRESEGAVRALEMGANDYVTKPLEDSIFIARIRSHLQMTQDTQLISPGSQTRSFSRSTGTVSVASDGSSDSDSFEVRPLLVPEQLIGQVLSKKYRIDGVLGSGGFGVVYRAMHLGLNKAVAIKLLSANQASGNVDPRKVQREAEAACRIDHPNAVLILDVDVVSAAIPYIVMELLEGHTLADEMVKLGQASPARCAEILLPVCDLLAQAHAANVVHRDVKPANIFLHQTRQGEVVKVLDFGTARIGEFVDTKQMKNTMGKITGTPEYTAPERLRDLPYNVKVDVYGLGVCAYAMLTGRLPFETKSGGFLGVAIKMVSQRPTPIPEIRPEIPAAVDAVVQGALQAEPECRSSVLQFGRGLAQATGVTINPTRFPNLAADEK